MIISKDDIYVNNETREGLDRAIPYFQQAIEEAPTDPLAYAGLANCYAISGWEGDIFAGDLSPREMMAKARDAALKALQLDEASSEAHTSLADVELILNWNWSGAEREFKRAIELNPNYSPAHACYAHYLVAMGRFNESVVEAKRSLEYAPKATRAAQRVSDLQIYGRRLSRFPPFRGEGHSCLRGESARAMATVANRLDDKVAGHAQRQTTQVLVNCCNQHWE
jgi:tetratricopeptide (TPR) repeat protein